MKKLLWLLPILLLAHAAFAQLVVSDSPLYQLTNGTSGTDRLRLLPTGLGQLIVRPGEPTEQLYTAEQVAFFHLNNCRFEPVNNFTVHLPGNRTRYIARDFAMVLDTGRVTLLHHHVQVILPVESQQEVHGQSSYLLRVKARLRLVVIPDHRNKYGDVAFSRAEQRLLQQVFGNDPTLQRLLAQQQLTSRNFPAYVRAYNQRFGFAR